jgi:mRNA interferase MazF
MTQAFGEVVLVPFPFTDQSGTKKRPAVIISSSGYNANRRDLVIMAITSQVRQPLGFGEALISDCQAAGLIKPSILKPVVTTIEQGLVVRTLGALSVNDLRALREVVSRAIG